MSPKRSGAASDSDSTFLPVKRSKVVTIDSQSTAHMLLQLASTLLASQVIADNLSFKTNHCLPHVNPLRVDGQSVISSHAESSLSLLKNLTRELMDDPSVIPPDPTVLQALSMLDGAFRRSDGQSALIDDSSRTCQTPQPSCPPSGSDDDEQTPVLPPILDKKLENAVFTHPAYGRRHDATYDRLEILGDAYIELIATRLVWDKFPDVSSGRISQIRELLVKNETLASFAQAYGFDRRAQVPADHTDQPKRWTKTKGDVFEAYVAAVILSRPVDGYNVAERWLTELWLPRLSSLGHQKAELRSKEALAKKVMGKGVKLEYVEERPAVQHKGSGTQTFSIGVYLTGWGWVERHLGSGQGPSKVAAGDEAARNALLDTALISEIAAAKQLAALKQ